MESSMIYLIKVNAVISVLFLTYFLLLRNEKFFKINRILLLAIILISFLSPLIPSLKNPAVVQLREELPVLNMVTNFYPEGEAAQAPSDSHREIAFNKSAGDNHAALSVIEVLFWTYGIVALVLFLRLVYQLLNLFLMIRKHPNRTQQEGIIYYEHDQSMSPFSFFHNLFVNRSQYTSEQLHQIIAHEKIHIRQWHSVDILLTEMTFAILWINPLAHILRQHVKLNLEYLADASVLAQGVDKKKYQLNILQSCLNPDLLPLTNLFNSSKLKLRIKMMNTRKTPIRNLYKYAFVVPVVALIYFLISPIEAVPSTPQNFVLKDLHVFEGHYQFQNDKNLFLQISVKEKNLVLKQLWDGVEILFERKNEFEFSGNKGRFPLKFKTNKEGNVAQVVAFDRDVWDKVKDYHAKETPAVKLTEEQLKPLEGYYLFQKNKAAYVQLFVVNHELKAKQMWDNVEYTLVSYSDVDFKTREQGMPVKFIKDEKGVVTQALVMNSDLLDKVEEYKPVERKLAKLTTEELKAVEGYYQSQKDGQYHIQVYAKGNGIMLKQLWDDQERFFDSESALAFSRIEPAGKLIFNKDANGKVFQMLSLSNEVWKRVDNYKPGTK